MRQLQNGKDEKDCMSTLFRFAKIIYPVRDGGDLDRGAEADGILLPVRVDGHGVLVPDIKHRKGMTLYDIYRRYANTPRLLLLSLQEHLEDTVFDDLLSTADRCGVSGQVIYLSPCHRDLMKLLRRNEDARVAPMGTELLVKPWGYGANMGAYALYTAAETVLEEPAYGDYCHNLAVGVIAQAQFFPREAPVAPTASADPVASTNATIPTDPIALADATSSAAPAVPADTFAVTAEANAVREKALVTHLRALIRADVDYIVTEDADTAKQLLW